MQSSGVVLTSEFYSKQLIRTVGDLFKNKILTDVTLVCDDRVKIEAHKVVLSAGSDLFRDFFTNDIHTHPLMFMKGIKHYQLQPVIQFLYHGEVTISAGHRSIYTGHYVRCPASISGPENRTGQKQDRMKPKSMWMMWPVGSSRILPLCLELRY